MPRFQLAPLIPEDGSPGRSRLPSSSQVPDGVQEPGGVDEIDVWEIFRILRRNIHLVALVVALVFGVTCYLVFTKVAEYEARAVFRITDARGAMTGTLAGGMETVLSQGTSPLLSELEVLKGRVVLGEVVDRLGLRLSEAEPGLPRPGDVAVEAAPEASGLITLHFGDDGVLAVSEEAEAHAVYGTPVVLPGVSFTVAQRPAVEKAVYELRTRDVAIDRLTKNLEARPRPNTDAVEVRYIATDPLLAQMVVNTAMEAFQSASVEAAQQQSRRRRLFVENQLAEVDSVLAEMQAALSTFRSDHHVYSSATKIAAQQEGLMAVDMRIEELHADRRIYESVLNTLSRPTESRARSLTALVSSPGVASNPAISQLYLQLASYEASRDSLTTGGLGSTDEHPEVQRLNGLIVSTESKLVDAARGYLEAIDARMAAFEELRRRNADVIEALPSSEAEEVRLVQRVATTQRMGEQLREELQRARIAEAVEAGQVEIVFPAPLPREPMDQDRTLRLGLGLLLGLLLGGGTALVREQLDRGINHKTDLEEVLRVPGLGVIPRIGTEGAGNGRVALGGLGRAVLRVRGANGAGEGLQLVTISDRRSATAEAYRTLRTNLIFSQGVRALRRLVVTSSTPREGKTTTASNLAVSFAQQGMRVLLVDCDLRRARVHQLFGIAGAPGLTELVFGHIQPGLAIRATAVEGLHVLPSGTLPPNPLELLGSERLEETLRTLGEDFDIVILDTPPLLAAADASVLGRHADGVVLVVRAGSTERGMALDAVRQLHGVGARVIGAVLNDPDARTGTHGHVYYEYHAESV